MSIIDLIQDCAKVPSFSTYEDRLHPVIEGFLGEYDHIKLSKIKDHNLLIEVFGNRPGSPVAITAHLDKINHYGETYPEVLETSVDKGRITGQMDDAAGLGMCLKLIEMARERNYPPLLVLFSEMEESTGLREHPHLLKNQGRDVGPQIGAWRLAKHVESMDEKPACFITLDTTPVFKGEPGVALYTEHWEKTGLEPDEELLGKLEAIKSAVLAIDNDVKLANGNNDYLVYGKHFGTPAKGNIPSIALEPAIYPYHQIGEGVFIEDIERIINILDKLLASDMFVNLAA